MSDELITFPPRCNIEKTDKTGLPYGHVLCDDCSDCQLSDRLDGQPEALSALLMRGNFQSPEVASYGGCLVAYQLASVMLTADYPEKTGEQAFTWLSPACLNVIVILSR